MIVDDTTYIRFEPVYPYESKKVQHKESTLHCCVAAMLADSLKEIRFEKDGLQFIYNDVTGSHLNKLLLGKDYNVDKMDLFQTYVTEKFVNLRIVGKIEVVTYNIVEFNQNYIKCELLQSEPLAYRDAIFDRVKASIKQQTVKHTVEQMRIMLREKRRKK